MTYLSLKSRLCLALLLLFTETVTAERRCDGPIIFVKEENKRLGGPFEVDIYTNLSLVECQAQCLRAEK